MTAPVPQPEARATNVLAASETRTRLERRLALFCYALGIVVFRRSIMDDTFIHLQYARHLRAYGELAFNHGEPSLGATSPLWMLLLAGLGPSETSARLLSVLCGALAVLVFGSLARRILGSNAWATAATCAWAGSLWLVRHAPNGMESAAGTLLVLLSVDLRARGGRSAWRDALFGLAVAGATLVRPEALLLALVYLAMDVASRAGRDRLAVWLPLYVAPLALWAAFAHAETGHFLPATGAAKSGGIAFAPLVWLRVIGREARILVAGHAVELLGLVAAFVLALRLEGRAALARLRHERLLPYAIFALLVLAGYAAADVQVQPRYLLLATPCLVLAGFAAWRAVVRGGTRTAALVAAASLATGAVSAVHSVYPATRDFADGVDRVLRPMALDVARRNIRDAVVATPDIGVMGWVSGARVLDLGGLVQPRVQDLVARYGYDTMLRDGHFLDLERADFVVDRSTERERFRDHTTRGLRWRVLHTGEVRGLGISRPATYSYTLYALEPEHAYGAGTEPGALSGHGVALASKHR